MDRRYQRTWAQRVVYRLLRVLARLASVILFRLQCLGRHHIPSEGGVLVCANHQSVMDPVLIGLACNRRLNYLARRSLFRHAAFGWFIRFLDAIPIDREGLGLEGLKETIRRLKAGEMVLIFPEGTRTPDGRLQPLKPGLCAVARRARAHLLPVAIDGAFDSWPRGAHVPRLRAVVLQFGPPITPDAIADATDEQLLDELAKRIRQCHERAMAIRRAQTPRTWCASTPSRAHPEG